MQLYAFCVRTLERPVDDGLDGAMATLSAIASTTTKIVGQNQSEIGYLLGR